MKHDIEPSFRKQNDLSVVYLNRDFYFNIKQKGLCKLMGDKFNNPQIGEGIYTVPEAAMILGISASKLRNWIKKYWEGKFISNKQNKIFAYTWGEKVIGDLIF